MMIDDLLIYFTMIDESIDESIDELKIYDHYNYSDARLNCYEFPLINIYYTAVPSCISLLVV